MTPNHKNQHAGLAQSHLPILERSYPDITGTVLAFDFGEKRIGLAVGEILLKFAHPLTTIHAEQNELKFSQIASIVQEWRPSLLVVGFSYAHGWRSACADATV